MEHRLWSLGEKDFVRIPSECESSSGSMGSRSSRLLWANQGTGSRQVVSSGWRCQGIVCFCLFYAGCLVLQTLFSPKCLPPPSPSAGKYNWVKEVLTENHVIHPWEPNATDLLKWRRHFLPPSNLPPQPMVQLEDTYPNQDKVKLPSTDAQLQMPNYSDFNKIRI